MNSLSEVMKEHYKDIYKSLPRPPSARESKLLTNDDATHTEVRSYKIYLKVRLTPNIIFGMCNIWIIPRRNLI